MNWSLARKGNAKIWPWLSGAGGTELLKPAAENLLQRWPVSKRVNSSRAPDDDPTLIEEISTAN
jgi:hypothetical protein